MYTRATSRSGFVKACPGLRPGISLAVLTYALVCSGRSFNFFCPYLKLSQVYSYWIVCLIVSCLLGTMAQASTTEDLKAAEQESMKITAQGGVKCSKQLQKCTAIDSVKVQKGLFVMYCDQLTAFMRKRADGKNEIWYIEAQGNIRFTGAPGEQGYGNHGTFNLDAKELILHGAAQHAGGDKELCLTRKRPTVQRGEHLLCGKILKVLFEDGPTGKLQIRAFEALEDVVLSTPIEISVSDYALYTFATRRAVLKGNVFINRKEGQLEGDHAVSDLVTNISQLTDTTPNCGENSFTERPKAFIQIKDVDGKALQPSQ